MDIKWWLDLKDDTKRLLAVGFGIIITLSTIVSYQYIERNSIEERHRQELTEKEKKIELLISQNASKDVDCFREKLIAAQKLYEEQKALNEKQLAINQKQAEESVYVAPGSEIHVQVTATDPEKDKLRYEWVLLGEVVARSEGGAFEAEPDTLPLKILNAKEPDYQTGKLVFKAPIKEGEYRIFAYVYDGKGKVGNANFPFYVKAKH